MFSLSLSIDTSACCAPWNGSDFPATGRDHISWLVVRRPGRSDLDLLLPALAGFLNDKTDGDASSGSAANDCLGKIRLPSLMIFGD